ESRCSMEQGGHVHPLSDLEATKQTKERPVRIAFLRSKTKFLVLKGLREKKLLSGLNAAVATFSDRQNPVCPFAKEGKRK
ncbi:MAG TPA: hypothetical protein VE860_27705, partial [Chthoniobacterales bacterium]|nr:hypothetical protein [Chthoniobacterales bacterium]